MFRASRGSSGSTIVIFQEHSSNSNIMRILRRILKYARYALGFGLCVEVRPYNPSVISARNDTAQTRNISPTLNTGREIIRGTTVLEMLK
jgi:hypothetical protein